MSTIRDSITQRQTSYGDIGLFVQRDGYSLPEFIPTEVCPQKHIPGSNNIVEQRMGFVPAIVTYTVYVGSQRDFQALVAMIGTYNTLTLADGATALPVPRETILGEIYARIPFVKLMGLSDAVSFIDGRIRCSATFQWSPASLEAEA